MAINIDSSYNLGYPFRDRANCKNNLHDDRGAVNDMNEAIKLNPSERYFYVDRATYFNNLEEFQLALNDYNKALEIWDKYIPAIIGKARVLVDLKRYEESLKLYQQLKDTSVFQDFDLFYRGIAKFQTNDKAGACIDWEIAGRTWEQAKDSLKKYCDKKGSR